ncbi:MAG: FMN-binding negative transcriptional regulator [Anaerolineales bacterium]
MLLTQNSKTTLSYHIKNQNNFLEWWLSGNSRDTAPAFWDVRACAFAALSHPKMRPSLRQMSENQNGDTMHIPKYYREEDREIILAFLKQNNFPAIVTFDGNRPIATHTPVEVTEDKNGIVIYSHISRANPQWKSFDDREILLIFQGAHTYISPRWYNHVNVPTWNYEIVHVYGKVREIQGNDLLSLLSRLVQNHESKTPYRLEELPQDFVHKEMKGVFGFAVDVTRIDAGYKLSQNRNDEDHENIIRELKNRGDENSKKIAASMREQREKSKNVK